MAKKMPWRIPKDEKKKALKCFRIELSSEGWLEIGIPVDVLQK